MFLHLFFSKIGIVADILILFVVLSYLYSTSAFVRYYVARFLFYFSFGVTMSLCIPLFLLSPGNVRNCMHFSYYIGRHFSYFYGVTWNLKGGRHLSENKEGVVIANHQHELDIIGMLNIWHIMGNTAAVAKQELFWNPFGLAAWIAGVVFINRSNSEKSHRTLNKTTSVLKKNTKIFMFPEGTRNSNLMKSNKLLPLKKGAFRIAIEAQVPIIPVLFSPYYFMDTERKILDFGGTVLVSAMPPISTSGLTLKHMDRLIMEVQEKMENEYSRLVKEVKENVIAKLESEEKRNRFLRRLGAD